MSEAQVPSGRDGGRVVWITAAALVVVLGLGWLVFNRRSCSGWQADVMAAFDLIQVDPAIGAPPHDAGVNRLAQLEDEKPPFCDTPIFTVIG